MTRTQAGFSLVELMVTIVVIGVVFSSVASMFLSVQRTQRLTGYIESATRAAQREIEVLRNNNYSQLTPGVDIDFTADLPDSLPAPRSGTVVVSEPTPGMRRVDVAVVYWDGSRQRTIKLSSLIGMLGITQ